MDSKIFIEDIAAKMQGDQENEVKTGVIRFEVGANTYRITIENNGLRIYKMTDSLNGAISIAPETSNVIWIQ